MLPDAHTLAAIQQRLGMSFHDRELLQEALTHPSFANESDDAGVAHNQRLEFLGDAILDFLVGRWLYERLPDASEGELTALRARLVRTEGLAELARALDLGAFMRFGHGEELSGGREKAANLCAGYEALIGAIYLDQGLETLEVWLLRTLTLRASHLVKEPASKDPKSALQEYTQAALHVTPRYELVETNGPDHARQFTVRVLVDGECWGTGVGNSKQQAQQAAAREALFSRAPESDGE